MSKGLVFSTSDELVAFFDDSSVIEYYKNMRLRKNRVYYNVQIAGTTKALLDEGAI